MERALTLRSPFGPSEWGDYVEELESLLRFSFDDRELTLPEILHVITNDLDGDRRCHRFRRRRVVDRRHRGRQGREGILKNRLRLAAAQLETGLGRLTVEDHAPLVDQALDLRPGQLGQAFG